MQRRLFVGIVAIAIIIGAGMYVLGFGQGDTRGSSQPVEAAAAAVPFTKMLQGSQPIISSKVNYVITSQVQLDRLWEVLRAAGTPPKLDFGKESVLAVFAKKGSTLTVQKIEDAAKRTVYIAITTPSEGCVVSATSAPYEFVMVASTTLPLTHQYITTTKACAQ